jgi:hypothetical protein
MNSDAGTVESAVPTTIEVIGSVAHKGVGARLAPNSPPTNATKEAPEDASAWLKVKITTFLESIFSHPSGTQDWLFAHYHIKYIMWIGIIKSDRVPVLFNLKTRQSFLHVAQEPIVV